MTTKARARPKQRISLREDIVRGGSPRVDREAGIIHDVKILGLKSDNGRTYLPEAIAAAIPLYEGVAVHLNHPKRATDSRDTDDTFGQLRNIRQADDGCLYGDLHYLKSHPFAERICEAAERMPTMFGLSHNADGHERQPGSGVIDQIFEVRGVDVVDRPATTKGLFEERARKPMNVTEFFQAVKFPDDKRALLNAELARLLEADMPLDKVAMAEDDLIGPGNEPMEPEAMDPAEALKGGFDSAISAVVTAALSGDQDPTEALKQIKELLMSHHKLQGRDASEEPVEEEDEPGKKKDEKYDKDGDEADEKLKEECDKEKMKEERDQLKRENQQLKAEKQVRELCEAHKIQPSKPLLKALIAAENDADRKALLESFKEAAGQGTGTGTNKSKIRTQVPESAGRKNGAGTLDDFVSALKSRN